MRGGCHCGAVRYVVAGPPRNHVLCHCTDCRRHAGAPLVAWAMHAESAITVTTGTPKIYASSEHGRRHFCSDCGTGLFYTNAVILPGIMDVQSATYDEPERVAPEALVQVAERIPWMKTAHELPAFERYMQS